jgi:hypothetical protein
MYSNGCWRLPLAKRDSPAFESVARRLRQRSTDTCARSSGREELPTFEEVYRAALLNSEERAAPIPLQLAIVRASEARSLDGALDPVGLHRHFGVSELPAITPTLVALICGVRGGKSKLGACTAIVGALTERLGCTSTSRQ